MPLLVLLCELFLKRQALGFYSASACACLKLKLRSRRFLRAAIRADQAQRGSLRAVLLYWRQIKGDNRWFAKALRALVFKPALCEQTAFWALRLFRKRPDEHRPAVLKGALRLADAVKAAQMNDLVRFFVKLQHQKQAEGEEDLSYYSGEPAQGAALEGPERALRQQRVALQNLRLLFKQAVVRSFHRFVRRALVQKRGPRKGGDNQLVRLVLQ